MISTNKFFHLPSLYVYILAVILLVTSVFHGAALLRHGIYVALGLNDASVPYSYNPELISFTPAAQEYLDSLAGKQTRQADTASFVKSSLLLILSLSSFYFFWRRASTSGNLEMMFSVRNFYFFLVSTLAFLIFFFAVSSGVNNLVQNVIVSNRLYYYDLHKPLTPPLSGGPEKRIVDIDELKENLAKQQQQYSEDWSRSQKRQVVDQLTVAFVAFPIFFLHDRKFKF